MFIASSCHIFLWWTLVTSFHLSSESSSPSYGLTVAEFGFTVRDEPTHCFGTEDFEHYRDTAEHCTLSGSCSRFYRYTAMDYGTFVLPSNRYSWGECGSYLFRPRIRNLVKYNADALRCYSESRICQGDWFSLLISLSDTIMPIFFWNVAGAFVGFIPTCLVLDVVYTDSRRALPFPALSELRVDLRSFSPL